MCENFAVELAEIISRDWANCKQVLDEWCKDTHLEEVEVASQPEAMTCDPGDSSVIQELPEVEACADLPLKKWEVLTLIIVPWSLWVLLFLRLYGGKFILEMRRLCCWCGEQGSRTKENGKEMEMPTNSNNY